MDLVNIPTMYIYLLTQRKFSTQQFSITANSIIEGQNEMTFPYYLGMYNINFFLSLLGKKYDVNLPTFNFIPGICLK